MFTVKIVLLDSLHATIEVEFIHKVLVARYLTISTFYLHGFF